jgi:hypothetical protein
LLRVDPALATLRGNLIADLALGTLCVTCHATLEAIQRRGTEDLATLAAGSESVKANTHAAVADSNFNSGDQTKVGHPGRDRIAALPKIGISEAIIWIRGLRNKEIRIVRIGRVAKINYH